MRALNSEKWIELSKIDGYTNSFVCTSGCLYVCVCVWIRERVRERDPWYNGYCHRKWTRQPEFKSLTRLIAFAIMLFSWEWYASKHSPFSYG